MSLKKLKRRIASVLKNSSINISKKCRRDPVFCSAFVQAVKLYDRHTDGEIESQLEHTIETFLTEQQKNDAAYVRKTKRELRRCREKYLIDFKEYFLYGFENLSDEERHQFMGDRESSLFYRSKEIKGIAGIFADKWKTYRHFQPFYGREVLFVDGEEKKEDFFRFCEKHPVIIVKPHRLCMATGVFKSDVRSGSVREELFSQLMEDLPLRKAFVIEEYIQQKEEMSIFHPESLNTVRYATYTDGKNWRGLYALVRTGQGESVVDNAAAGGVFAAVNPETGIITTDAMDKLNEWHITHPDSGIQFKGHQLPEWDKLLELVDKLVKVVPEQKYVGWDLAYSVNGWVMVEGNSRGQPYGNQAVTKKGLRSVLEGGLGADRAAGN